MHNSIKVLFIFGFCWYFLALKLGSMQNMGLYQKRITFSFVTLSLMLLAGCTGSMTSGAAQAPVKSELDSPKPDNSASSDAPSTVATVATVPVVAPPVTVFERILKLGLGCTPSLGGGVLYADEIFPDHSTGSQASILYAQLLPHDAYDMGTVIRTAIIMNFDVLSANHVYVDVDKATGRPIGKLYNKCVYKAEGPDFGKVEWLQLSESKNDANSFRISDLGSDDCIGMLYGFNGGPPGANGLQTVTAAAPYLTRYSDISVSFDSSTSSYSFSGRELFLSKMEAHAKATEPICIAPSKPPHH